MKVKYAHIKQSTVALMKKEQALAKMFGKLNKKTL